MEHQVFQVCETRNRLPNYDSSIEAATSVRTVATTKTENSRRTVYLLDDLFHDLESYKAIQDSIARQYPGYNPDGYVFCQENGQPYEPHTYQDLFKRCVRQAGIPDANFHALRHTCATIFAQNRPILRRYSYIFGSFIVEYNNLVNGYLLELSPGFRVFISRSPL